jgi:hypothetical protein
MLLRSLFSLLVLAGVSACATAQTGRLDLPSYSHLAARASDTTNISLSGTLLRFAARFVKDDRDAKQLFAHLDGVQVRSFEFSDDNAYSSSDVERVREQLTGPNWSQVVRTRDRHQGENVDVYVCLSDGKACGLAVIVAAARELTIVNVVGSISLDQLDTISQQWHVHTGASAD